MREFVFDEDGVALGFVDWNQEVSKLVKSFPHDHTLAKNLKSATDSGGSPLFTACVFGLAAILDDLTLMIDYDWNRSNDLGQSGIYLAAAAGQETIVESLLGHGVDINAPGGKLGHPLHAACFGGHVSVVKILLDHGANPKTGSKSALECSFLAGHENIALLLLTDKFDIADQAEYDSILQKSAEAGFTSVLAFLQKEYASLYGELGSSRCRAVEVAIFRGRLGVVERHIQRLSNPNTDLPADAIATAALGGQDMMIDLLVKQELDLNKQGVFGTPLRAACVMCRESTVRLLLKLGASLHTSESLGEPLQAAAMQGHMSITRTLLTNGANVNSKGGLYGNTLQAAAHRGHLRVVELLLDAGADVYQDGWSRDALHAASEGGHEEITSCAKSSLSKRHKAAPTWDEQLKSKGWRQLASTTNVLFVIEKLRGVATPELETVQPYRERLGYQVIDRDSYALRAAAAKGHIAVVELLLSHFETMDLSKSEIVAAFKEACENGQTGVVSKFISGPRKLKDLKTALEAAALNGHLTAVDLLVHHEDRQGLTRVENFSINRPASSSSSIGIPPTLNKETLEYDSTACSLLKSGSKAGHLTILRRGQSLVSRRCTSIASRHLYGHALIIAAANCKLDVITALLEKRFDFDTVELTNVLIPICAWGSVEALKLLLGYDENKVLGVEQYSQGLNKAARKGKSHVVSYWLKEYSEHQQLVVESRTMIDAAGHGFMDILRLLTEKIRLTDMFGETLNQCLQVAARNSHQKVLEYLIEEGADLNTAVEKVQYTSEDGDLSFMWGTHQSLPKQTPLQAALIGFKRFKPVTIYDYRRPSWIGADASSQQLTCKLLLGKGTDPNEAGEYQKHPLTIAAEYGTVATVQALISSGAYVETATEEYGTALEVAAGRELGSLPIIKTLLEASKLALFADLDKAAALDKALSYFGDSCSSEDKDIGSFLESDSILEVLDNGAGAAVKALLEHLPKQKADDFRYGLLSQMVCGAGDQEYVELLLRRGMDVNSAGHYYGTALQAACRVGNIAMVECLLNSGANVNILQGAYGTALRAAILGDREELIRKLISLGADVDLRYKNKDKSILHLALDARNSVVFKALISAGADMNVETPNEQPILVAACKYGEAKIIELLLANGADVNTLGIKPECYSHMPAEEASPLHAACAEGHHSVVRLLLDHGVDIEKTNESSATPLIIAIRNNHLSVVHLLLGAGADVNHGVHTSPLSEAAKDYKLDILEVLLSAGALVGGPSTKVNALAAACIASEHMVVEMLLEALSRTRDEVEICSEALSAAMKKGDDQTVCLLLEFGVAPTFGMLRQACSAGSLEALKMLVNMGFDVNEDDGEDHPLLHVAACHSRPEILEFLINQGANINLHSTRYGSPMSAAMEGTMAPFLRSRSQHPSCQSLAKQLPLPGPVNDIIIYGFAESSPKPGYKEVLRCEQIVCSLLDAGAEADSSMRSFGNVLHLASYMGSTVIVRQLLERTENVNVFGGYFGSPLLAALKEGHEEIVELLLDRNIDVNASAPEHGSAFYFACAHGSEGLVQDFLNHGGDINAYDDKLGSALAAAATDPSDHRGVTRSSEEQRAIVDLLLHHGSKVQIREGDLIAAASRHYSTLGEYDFLRVFLEYDPTAVATEEVIVKIIKKMNRYDAVEDPLPLLLKRDGGLGTTPAMLEAVENVAAMELLLRHKPTCQVTSRVLESAAQRYSNAFTLVDLLLTHDPQAPITEAAVKAGMRSRTTTQSEQSVMTLLLIRDPEFRVTDTLLKAAENTRDMEVLLNRRTEDQTISSELLEMAVKCNSEGPAMLSLLLKYDKSVKITPAIVHLAISYVRDQGSILKILLERDPTLNITSGDLIDLVTRTGRQGEEETRKAINVLLEFRKTFKFTAEVREALDNEFPSQSDKKIKEMFYQLERQ